MILKRRAMTALAVGTSLLASTAASPLQASAITTAWTTDHFDPGRSGNDTDDAALGGSVNPAWTSDPVNGRIYGEPLYLNGMVYVATQRNSIYAFNATTGHIIWQLPLASTLPPVPLSEVQAETGVAGGCGNIDPLGITGTPVIDPSLGAGGTLFAVAETYQVGVANSIEHRLVEIDLSSHTKVGDRNIDPVATGFTDGSTRGLEQQRGALNRAGGEVVVPYGGLSADCGAYHGFAVSSLENLTGPANSFEVDATHTGGGIWAASGAAVDGSNNVYVATGNGAEPSGNQNYEFSDGVMKLSPTMAAPADTAHYFAPDIWHANNNADADLGSVGPILIPRGIQAPLIFQTGKQHIGFLLDSSNLGGIGGQLFPPLATEAASGHVCDGEAFGGNAYANGYLYVPCSEGLRALTVDTSAPSFARAWQAPSDAFGPPIVAGGRVWTHGPGKIYGLNATSGAIEITLDGVSTPYNFGSPSAGGGRLFFASDTSVVAFWSGPPPPPPPPPGGTDLYAALLNGGGSGMVEVHALSQSTHYAQFSVHAASAFGASTAADWQFFAAGFQGDGQPDLFGIHMRNTNSGQVEVHVLSAASGYQTFILHAATSLPAVPPGQFQFALGSFAGDHRSNLYAIVLNSTGSNTVEVHALSEASSYATWVLHAPSALAQTSSSTWQFKVGDRYGSGDLIGILHTPTTGSGGTEAHILSRVSGYQNFTVHTATPLGYTNDTQFAYTLGDHDNDGIPDLYAVLMNNNGSGQTEVHILSGASSYSSWIEHTATGLSQTTSTSWQFSTH